MAQLTYSMATTRRSFSMKSALVSFSGCLLLALLMELEANPTSTPSTSASSSSPSSSSSSAFLDVYLRVQPADDFCGARQCNISYALSVLTAQNQFDLQSLMLQDGSMTRGAESRGTSYFFEDNTVIRLSRELHEVESGKLYLGVMLFDMPDDIQDYLVIEVTDVVQHRDRRVKMEFSSETARIQVHVYKRTEAGDVHDDRDHSEDEDDNRSSSAGRQLSHHRHHHPSNPEVLDAGSGNQIDNSLLSSPYSSQNSQNEVGGKECECVGQNCGCCQHVTIRKIHLDDTACVNISYVSEDIGLRLTLSVDNHVYYSKELSVRNPPPVCFEVPHLRDYASLCMRLYNLNVTEQSISGCTELEAKLYHIKVAREKLGCFRIPI